MLKRISVVLLLLCVAHVKARPLSEESGWQFTISLNAGYVQGTSQFNINDDNAVTEDLNNNGQSSGRAIVYPFARVQYTFDDLKTQLYLGNSRDQVSTAQFQYELGVVHQFEDKTKLTLAAFPRYSFLNDTWKDPFLVGEERQETKINTAGGRIAIERMLGGPLSFKYAIATSDITDERSGESDESLAPDDITLLDRDSLYQRVEVETMFPISKGVFLKPNLQYTLRDAEGDANSYDEYAGQLSLLLFRSKFVWITTFKGGTRRYQASNPVFNVKQDGSFTSIFSILNYKKPFNLDNWSWTLIAGYNQESYDISFYDRNGLILSTGAAFTF